MFTLTQTRRVDLVVGYASGIVRGLRVAASWQGVYTNAAMAVVPPLYNRLLMGYISKIGC